MKHSLWSGQGVFKEIYLKLVKNKGKRSVNILVFRIKKVSVCMKKRSMIPSVSYFKMIANDLMGFLNLLFCTFSEFCLCFSNIPVVVRLDRSSKCLKSISFLYCYKIFVILIIPSLPVWHLKGLCQLESMRSEVMQITFNCQNSIVFNAWLSSCSLSRPRFRI